jgi:hypothetical protein
MDVLIEAVEKATTMRNGKDRKDGTAGKTGPLQPITINPPDRPHERQDK